MRSYGPARVPTQEVADETASDAADAEIQADLIAAVLPPAGPHVRRGRNCGLAGRGSAHLLDAARLIQEEWGAMTPASIVHCWVKSTILPLSMSAVVVSTHSEYTGGGDAISRDVDEVLSLLRKTTLGTDAFSGESVCDVRDGVMSWLAAEQGEEVILDTADVLSTSEEEQPTET